MKINQVNAGNRSGRLIRPKVAFSLLEVMIAVGIFCVGLMSILGVMTRGLAAARGLQISGPDCGMLAAEMCLTNRLEDGKGERGDFGKLYPGFTWEYEAFQVGSNGLFQVDFFIWQRGNRGPELYKNMSTWFYRPDSVQSPISRPVFGPR